MDMAQLYEMYFRDVALYVRSLSADANLAEEVTQETFFKALRAIDSFDGQTDIRAWLFTIARNTLYSHYRSEKKWADAPPDENIVAASDDVVLQMMDEDAADRIHQALHSLAEPYKEVFSLRVFGELPYEKIARLFGKSSGWARVTYYRAKGQIIQAMEVDDDEKPME